MPASMIFITNSHVSWIVSNVSITSKCTKFFNALAKFSIPFQYYFYCNKSSIPRPVWDEWRQGVSFLALI